MLMEPCAEVPMLSKTFHGCQKSKVYAPVSLPCPVCQKICTRNVEPDGNSAIDRIKYRVDVIQGPSAFDPRSGSSFFGGLSTSSLYRRFSVDLSSLFRASGSSIYRRYVDDISAKCNISIYLVCASLSKVLQVPRP